MFPKDMSERSGSRNSVVGGVRLGMYLGGTQLYLACIWQAARREKLSMIYSICKSGLKI
jgi:hypothetical protein